MKYFAFIVFVLGITSAGAQTYKVFKGDTINRVDAKGKKQGLWRKYYSNDTLFSEGYYKDSKHIGTFNTFHRNGVRQSVLRFRGTTEISDAVLYNDSAQLIAKGKYIDRNKDSVWVYYNGSTGKITAEEIYKKGVKEGTWKIYYPGGEIAETEVYRKGKKNGPYKKYFENGKIRFEGNMINDLLEGKVTLYTSEGRIWQQGVYKAGDKHGIWTTFKEDGSVEKQEEFINGLPKNPVKDVPIESPQDTPEK
jgi:antitoxin component YwqK of YwqJK toxin-antitoxin module